MDVIEKLTQFELLILDQRKLGVHRNQQSIQQDKRSR